MTTIAARLVPVASRSPYPSQKINRGTITVPPPTPNRPLNAPAAVAIATSFRSRSRDTGGDTSGHDGRHRTAYLTAEPVVAARIAQLVAPLRDDPASAAVLCD